MEVQQQRACFNEFPDQCVGCPEYMETRLDASELMWLSGMGLAYPQLPVAKVVKECNRYHKRKVEYLK